MHVQAAGCFIKEHICKSLWVIVAIVSQQCHSWGLAQPPGCLVDSVLCRNARGPDTAETNGSAGGPQGTAVMNGSRQCVHFSRFMGLVLSLGWGYLLMCTMGDKDGQCVCACNLVQPMDLWTEHCLSICLFRWPRRDLCCWEGASVSVSLAGPVVRFQMRMWKITPTVKTSGRWKADCYNNCRNQIK